MKRAIIYRSQLLPRSETFVRQQIHALKKWSPIVMGERRIEDGLSLTGLDVRVLNRDELTPSERFRLRLARLLRSSFKPITRQFAAVEADVLHIHFGTDAVDVWPHVRELNLPMLVTLHGYDINICREWWASGKGGVRRRNYPKQLLQLASNDRVRFIAVSEAIRRRAIAFGIPSAKVQVRYIGVDTQLFAPGGLPLAQREPCILFVGRLVEKKGAACLIRAFAIAQKIVPHASLVMIGDGPLRSEIECLARDLKVPARFLGSRSSDEIIEFMHQAKALCLPSITARNGDAEGLPIVILEAQAAGLPVITSARGAVGEAVLDGNTGHVFEEHDIGRLAKLLVATLNDDDEATELAIQARQRIKTSFDLQDCTMKLEQSFDQAAYS